MPRISSSKPNREILEAALQGLEAQKQKLEEQIVEVRRLLGTQRGRPRKVEHATEAGSVQPKKERGSQTRGQGKTKRTLSPEARKRIAAAQKKRWATYRKSNPS